MRPDAIHRRSKQGIRNEAMLDEKTMLNKERALVVRKRNAWKGEIGGFEYIAQAARVGWVRVASLMSLADVTTGSFG